MATLRHDRLLDAGAAWAAADARVRALLLKGSLGRGEGDEHSDIDFVVVSHLGKLKELWPARATVAAGLGRWLGGFDEVAWQAPHTYIGFYDGPVKVDFFFQEGEPHIDPWLRDGFRVLFDPEDLAAPLRRQLADRTSPANLSEFDAHAWDWLWWLHVKLARGGEAWLVHNELVKFCETILVSGYNALSAEPWRGLALLERRLPSTNLAELRAATPAGIDRPELARALIAAREAYARLRQRLARERGMPLAEELARQVLGNLPDVARG
jgi:hypothetical protein